MCKWSRLSRIYLKFVWFCHSIFMQLFFVCFSIFVKIGVKNNQFKNWQKKPLGPNPRSMEWSGPNLLFILGVKIKYPRSWYLLKGCSKKKIFLRTCLSPLNTLRFWIRTSYLCYFSLKTNGTRMVRSNGNEFHLASNSLCFA